MTRNRWIMLLVGCIRSAMRICIVDIASCPILEEPKPIILYVMFGKW